MHFRNLLLQPGKHKQFKIKVGKASKEEHIKNTKYNDIDMITPIHLLSSNDLYLLESHGYLKELQDSYPDKKYLNYLTNCSSF